VAVSMRIISGRTQMYATTSGMVAVCSQFKPKIEG
jgi:hypothetical protein